jgi:cation:H+ antiporter
MSIVAQSLTVAAFIAGLCLCLAASELLVRGLTRLGVKLGLGEGLLGLVAALGADSPELSSSVIAILAGAKDIGVGVIVGSNLFNLAALLGLSALVAGGISLPRAPLIFDAAVGLGITLAAAAMVGGLAPPAATIAITGPLAAVYVVVLVLPPRQPRVIRNPAKRGSWVPVLLLPVAVTGVVGGALVMVREALTAQPWLHLSSAVLGTLVLAALTSLPNLWAALHFARHGRGTALYSTAVNSNTINLLGGLILPALFIGLRAARGSLVDFTWLIGLTLLAFLAPLPRGRLSRLWGVCIVGVYLTFAALRVAGT